jgi:PE-PPE domain
MGYGRCVGRVGALAVATRVTVSIGVAVLVVVATVAPAPTVSPAVKLSASTAPCTDTDVTCALIMGFTSLPTPDDAYIDPVMNQFIAPTHPEQTIEPVAVSTPEEGWPLTGLIRLGCAAVGAPSLCGPGGPAWPDEPWWKLSGLFDLTYDQSVRAGVADLEAAMAEHPNDHLVIYGYSQAATIANLEKQRLAEQYPEGTKAPDIDFVLGGDLNLPNGGLEARFPGLYIPILDWSFNGPEPTDTQFDTVVVTRQYDGVADFPLYPLNVISLLNAVLGFFYVHLNGFDVSLPPDPRKTSPAYQGRYGDTDYYFFETEDLPLFGPLRTLGVPKPVIDVVEPVFREVVELGYDRSIRPWEPTPARLIPPLDPATVAGDLVDAIGEGITNAAALIGSPAPLSSPAPAVTQHDLAAPQRTVGGELATTRDRLNAAIGTVKSVIGDGRTIVRSARSDNGSPAATATSARKTPVRDAVKHASSDITKVVTKVSDSIKQVFRSGNDDEDTGDGGEGGAGKSAESVQPRVERSRGVIS